MDQLVDIVWRAATNGTLGRQAQVLVRLHPRDELSAYEHLRDRAGLVIEKRFHTWSMEGRDEVNITEDDFLHLADTLYHCDVLVNIFSTVMIEASIFDKPVVNVAFDGYGDQPYLFSARRFPDYTHLQRVVATRGVRTAEDAGQLRELLRMYLDDPSIDAAGRRRLVEENCYRVDGRSGERQAAFLLETLATGASRR
jgi:CDP-glycerol glycerophosphotransferase (TagB/SpsB family)